MNVVALNHGSTGLISWDEDHNTPPDLLASAATIGKVLPEIIPIIFAPGIDRVAERSSSLDIALWPFTTNGRERVMVLAANIQHSNLIEGVGPFPKNINVTMLFNTDGAAVSQDNVTLVFKFTELGSIGFIVNY
jgi:hypothetical protein